MITKEELQEGIHLCKLGEPTPEKMIRLGAYYTVYDHLFGEEKSAPVPTYSTAPAQQEQAEPIDTSGNSDFLSAARGKNSAKVLDLMDELMETMKMIQPRIYDSVMRRIKEL